MTRTSPTDRTTFAKRWVDVATSRFNEAVGPQVDGAVFNLSAAEACLDNSISLAREAYPQQLVRQRLRAMSRTLRTAETWLTVALASLAVSWWGAVLYLVYRAYRHFR